MPGQSAIRGAGRRRAGSGIMRGVAFVLVISTVAALGVAMTDGRAAHATVLAADAASYVPSLSNLPPGYREEAVDAVGGDLEPTISLRRAFVKLDGSRRVVVDVSLGSSIQDAHTMLGARMNQLIRYHGWRVTPNAPFGESGFRGTGPTPSGAASAMIAFRVQAVVAEVNVSSTSGNVDMPLLDNLARLVENRINTDPEAVAVQPGLPEAPPQQLPGREPVVIGPVTAGVVPPGAGVPVVPPSSAPTGPGGPASPSGPTAPTGPAGPSGPATTPPGGGRGRGSGLE